MTDSYIIADADTGKRLAGAKNAVSAEEKALAQEAKGHRVAVLSGPELPQVTPAPVSDVPEGYKLLERHHRLAPSTLKRDPQRWRAEARTFPEEWGRWGQGHATANVAYACLDRGLIEIAVPVKGSKPYLYRQKRARS